MHENVRVCYFLNCMGQAVPSFRLSTGKTAFTELYQSCQWFITVINNSPANNQEQVSLNTTSLKGLHHYRLICLVMNSDHDL